jgi:nucleotide-binding universal stress UspA family protein
MASEAEIDSMIRDVLVNLTIGAKHDPAAQFGAAVAAELDAHASAVAFAWEPVIPATVMGGMVSVDIIEAQRAENEKTARAAVAAFEATAKRDGLAVDSHVFTSTVAGAADTFGRMARRFDLSVVAQADPDDTAPVEDMIIEAALFQSGRPVIVVPYIHKEGLKLDRVMVCWDGGRTAARAIGDATPLLERAKAVDVVTVTGEQGKWDQIPGVEMGHHLARHRLKVDVKRIPAVEGDVEGTLLSYAADIGADMIVMGGYGHSRLREFILGGVTRGMLKSMTVPCFMSH